MPQKRFLGSGRCTLNVMNEGRGDKFTDNDIYIFLSSYPEFLCAFHTELKRVDRGMEGEEEERQDTGGK